MKSRNYFFTEEIQQQIRNNIKTNKAAEQMAARFLADTGYWKNLSYKELTSLMFSPELKRSWFVMSDGICPVCKESVPMYNWLHDPMNTPWKMKCPHCSTLFPSNDFGAYYHSGLDDTGRFSHEKADRSLLVSSDGGIVIDDGNGWYDENGKRYMFIGAFLAHSQWELLIVNGIFHLSLAYILTGQKDYALRAALLLHTVSKFWPEFDFYTQGIMYEQEFKSTGYVAYWVNSNNDVRSFALAYDQIFDAIKDNKELESITGKSSESICREIEERIFRDSLANVKKIHTNPPETPITIAIVRTVLDYDSTCNEILQSIDDLIEEATRIDGMTGESGLVGYAAIGPRALANLLCLYSNINDKILHEILDRNPQLYKTYKFHIDSWYDCKYYPGIGDSSLFASTMDKYTGLFSSYNPKSSVLYKSREWFALELAKYFNEPDFARAIFHSNQRSYKGVFSSNLYVADPSLYEEQLKDILDSNGSSFSWKSINYGTWRLSLLHTGSRENKTLLAMPYSSGANHCHHDALSFHLFSKGLNMTADFGYPPVNYGGWETKEANWYKQPAAHNTVVIDEKMHTNLPAHADGVFYRYPAFGTNILFVDHDFVHGTYNEASGYTDTDRFERFSMLIDVSEDDCYCVDVFRAAGGKRHDRFQRSTYADMTVSGLTLSEGNVYDPKKTIMRNFMTDEHPDIGWFVDFKLKDENCVMEKPRALHLRYYPLTPGAAATICESWVDITRMVQTDEGKTGNREVWIPTLIESAFEGRTQFTGILEPYEDVPFIETAEKLDIQTPGFFTEAISIRHSNGIEDIILLNDPGNQKLMKIKKYGIETDALMAVLRFDKEKLIKNYLIKGTYLSVNGIETVCNMLP